MPWDGPEEKAGIRSFCAMQVPASTWGSRRAGEAAGKDKEPGWRCAIAAI